ncbi:hypothetical protein PVIIG_01387 [Plasmodium vivax India VII]|uniref:CWC16 domain-containing protein n=2 Tax=Plasmodium vivax TaxID=5855 RepID=A0A0J9S5V3_PLAVI|nr:hypothetical protein PVIIG_01387 [Plasmodium vivax India VII]KMZ84580.1 hypothetical protein PVBG_00360 [Plasmodium vivax Brazil I]
MLSLKASRADNFYYGSVEEERAKKKKQQEEKKRAKKKKDYSEIKFEIPYTIICNKCKAYVYKGERFNSERRQVGFYLSSPFYSFSFTCKKCPNEIAFETNPKDCSYDVIRGARKKNEHFENVLTEQGRNNVNSIDFEKNKKKKTNPFLLLEVEALRRKGQAGGGGEAAHRGEKPPGSGEAHEELPNEDRSNGDHSNGDRSNEDRSNEDRSNEDRSNEDRSNEDRSNEDRSNEDDPPSEEQLNDVIKENYRRNDKLKNDFSCNSNLRKQLRDMKKDKIQQLQERKRKNIFINIVEGDPLEEVLVKRYVRFGEKLRRTRGAHPSDQGEGVHLSDLRSKDRPGNGPPIKQKLAKSNLIKKKKSSIFDRKYLKKGR